MFTRLFITETALNKRQFILLKEWIGPYEGVPAFDQMKVEDVITGMIQDMDLNL